MRLNYLTNNILIKRKQKTLGRINYVYLTPEYNFGKNKNTFNHKTI